MARHVGGAGVTLRMEGGKELAKALAKLGQRVEKKLLKRAVVKGARPIARAAKVKVVKVSGMLGKSIGVKSIFYPSTGTAVAVIGARVTTQGRKRKTVGWAKKFGDTKQKPANYAHLVEFGTKPHWIPTTLIDGTIVRRPHLHPGTPAKPFMRPAYDQHWRGALNIFGTQLRRDIAKEVSKLRAGR